MNQHKKADLAVELGEKLLGNHNYAYKHGRNYYAYMDGETIRVSIAKLAELYDRWIEHKFEVKPSKIAAFIAATVTLNQTENNWIVTYEEIEDAFPSLEGTSWSKDEDYLEAIESELYEHPQFAGDCATIERDCDGFDCVAWTDYIACEYNAGDDW